MDFKKLSLDLKFLERRNRLLSLALIGLSIGLALALGIILHLLIEVRTIVVPPNLQQSFWVTQHRASASYLNEMGAFITWLILDVTPSTIDWKKDLLLNYVAPDQHGALKTRQELAAERLKRMSASTFFLPQQLVPNETNQSVVIRGRLRTQINGQETTNELHAYLIEFIHQGGRLHLKTFKEIPNDKPLTR